MVIILTVDHTITDTIVETRQAVAYTCINMYDLLNLEDSTLLRY